MSDQNEPLLFDQMTREWALLYSCHASIAERIKWREGNPPVPGMYLVTVSIDVFDTDDKSYRVRIEYWDGECYATLGAYATPERWMYLPDPWKPTPDHSS